MRYIIIAATSITLCCSAMAGDSYGTMNGSSVYGSSDSSGNTYWRDNRGQSVGTTTSQDSYSDRSPRINGSNLNGLNIQ